MGKQFKLIKKTSNNLDMTKIYIQLILLYRGFKLGETDVQILTEFMISGYNKSTKDKIIQMRLVKNSNCLQNLLSKYRKMGLIVKEGFSERLCDEMNIQLDNSLNLINFIIDNR